MANKVTRVFTGLAGLPACQEPHKELVKLYGRVLRGLQYLPKDSKYRIATEELIKERKLIVESTPNPEDIEQKIGAGLCEELMEQARNELQLIDTMKKFEPWQPLEEKPLADQWKWPPQ